MFALQVLGAVAQLERSLISERTKAGMKAAANKGRIAGNPGMRSREPEAIRKIAAARHDGYVSELIASADTWLPIVQRLRPSRPWPDVVAIVNRSTGQAWTVDRMRRAVRSLVRERIADPLIMERSPRRPTDDRLVTLVSGIAMANPDLSLRDIAAQLQIMNERTPRGGRRWSASSVKNLLDRSPDTTLVRRLAAEEAQNGLNAGISYEEKDSAD